MLLAAANATCTMPQYAHCECSQVMLRLGDERFMLQGK